MDGVLGDPADAGSDIAGAELAFELSADLNEVWSAPVFPPQEDIKPGLLILDIRFPNLLPLESFVLMLVLPELLLVFDIPSKNMLALLESAEARDDTAEGLSESKETCCTPSDEV